MAKKARKKIRKTKRRAAPKKKTGRKAKSNRGKRYTTARKKSLLEKFFSHRLAGMTALQAAKKVKVTYVTLLKWQKELKFKAPKIPRAKKATKKASRKRGRPARKARRKPGRKRKATRGSTVAVSGKGQLVLETPSGYRIEGLTTNDLIRVLKAAR